MDVWSRRTFVPNADLMTRLKSGTASKAMIRVPPRDDLPGSEKTSVFSGNIYYEAIRIGMDWHKIIDTFGLTRYTQATPTTTGERWLLPK
jgi:hypothetical protein